MSFCVGVLTVTLHLPHSHSLKERRSVVNSLKERARLKFDVSVCEEASDTWQSATLAFATVAESESVIEQRFARLRELLDNEPRATVLNPRIHYHV